MKKGKEIIIRTSSTTILLIIMRFAPFEMHQNRQKEIYVKTGLILGLYVCSSIE